MIKVRKMQELLSPYSIGLTLALGLVPFGMSYIPNKVSDYLNKRRGYQIGFDFDRNGNMLDRRGHIRLTKNPLG